MRIAGNKLKHLGDFYHTSLAGHYERSEIDALFCLAAEHYLGFSKADVLSRQAENLNQSDLLKLYDAAKALAEGIPIQYILKEAWFYNLKFHVDNSVLIPRPETEELVDLVIRENPGAGSLLDIGTGSGCIPIAVKKNLPGMQVQGCDLSPVALAVAKKNAAALGTEIRFTEADALDADFAKNFNTRFDVIISNPPYIILSEKQSMARHVTDHEPHLALFVEGEDEIIFYRRIIDHCRTLLNDGGRLYFELNPLSANLVQQYAAQSQLFTHTSLLKDMSGHLRFFKGVK